MAHICSVAGINVIAGALIESPEFSAKNDAIG